jgi:hypothetical protein
MFSSDVIAVQLFAERLVARTSLEVFVAAGAVRPVGDVKAVGVRDWLRISARVSSAVLGLAR